MAKFVVVLVCLLLLFSGCAVLDRTCGNGVCNNWETRASCPVDCNRPLPESTGERAGPAEGA